MARFAMYVVNLEEGTVQGTNDSEAITNLPEWPSEQYLVIHSTYGDFHLGDDAAAPIQELTNSDDGDEDEDEDDES